MKNIITAISELTLALYGEPLSKNDVEQITVTGRNNALKLYLELKRRVQEERNLNLVA
jgi:chromosome segregation and condensation protein ScpB